jgi:hypothetical protein
VKKSEALLLIQVVGLFASRLHFPAVVVSTNPGLPSMLLMGAIDAVVPLVLSVVDEAGSALEEASVASVEAVEETVKLGANSELAARHCERKSADTANARAMAT